MLRLSIIGLLLLSACDAGVTTIRAADGGRKKIDCSESYIATSLPGNYTCEQFDKYQSSNPDRYNGRYGGIFQMFSIYGRSNDGTRLSLAVSKAISNGFFSPSLASTSPEEQIRDYNNDTKKAQDWGTLRRTMDASVMNFSDGAWKCFGFKKYGGFAYGGFAHVTSGYFCRTRQSAFGDDDAASLINTIIVRDSISAAPK